jgi:hypothetical protein
VKIDGQTELLKVEETKADDAEKAINDFIDRCASTKCRDGETCILNKDGDAECACTTQCEDPKDERLMVRSTRVCPSLLHRSSQVCTKSNHTYTSDCEFFQMQCWCRKSDERCTRQAAVTDTIDYFGRCQSTVSLMITASLTDGNTLFRYRHLY